MKLEEFTSRSMHWPQRIGQQRDWVWRGWQTRYSFQRATQSSTRPPLLLIHGFGAAIEHWRKNIPILSRTHTVYALDLLGFGASRKVAADFGTELWAAQVYDFWRTFVGEPMVLVGNSVGSLVCLAAAARHPEMVAGIVLLNVPDVSLRQAALPAWLAPIVTGLENAIASPTVLKLLLRVLRRPVNIRRWAGFAYEDNSAIDEELLSILSAPAYDEGAGDTFSSLFRAVRQPQFALPTVELLPALDLPILLLWGTRDRMVPFALARAFLELNPRLEFVELEAAGHCPHDECPDRFNALLLDWLKAVGL
ncbi:alpha/beta fold hydrolase [Oscillatoria sp. FACHB-1406]|nr:alpha/beta fold hydrolase [Oscillatoria sp. FACHB-1406]